MTAMKKRELKERLAKAKETRRRHDEEMKTMSFRIQALTAQLHEAQDVPPPEHIELLIAARVELALCSERAQQANVVPYAKKQVIREIQGALKLRIHEPGTTNEWLAFSDWVGAWAKEILE